MSRGKKRKRCNLALEEDVAKKEVDEMTAAKSLFSWAISWNKETWMAGLFLAIKEEEEHEFYGV